MIIGITGKRLSGKDTIGRHLTFFHGFERRAFADKMKDGVAALFDITREEVDEFKSDRGGTLDFVTVRLDIGGEFTKEFGWVEFLQRYGTDMGRKVWGEDFWVRLAFPDHVLDSGRDLVTTDVRFNNEAAIIKRLGGCIIRVSRDVVDEANDGHESEFGIDDKYVDYELENNSDFTSLYKDVDEILEDIRADS